MKQKLSFIPHLLALSALYLLAGCASVAVDSHKLTGNVNNVNENFTIEGKFKLSHLDSKETGYFDLKKYNNSIIVTLGKNYLFPEESFILDIRETLKLSKFIGQQSTEIKLPNIPLRDFLSLFLQTENTNIRIDDTNIILEFNEKKYPSKISLNHLDIELVILVKKIWKN